MNLTREGKSELRSTKMKLSREWRVWLALALCGPAIVLALALTPGTHAGNEPIHMTTDWSARHLIFSPPKNLMQGFQLSENSRYVQQWIRRNTERQYGDFRRYRHAPEGRDTLQGDWSINMGSGAKVGAATFPAKFSFDATTASCSADFVVYNTGLAGVSGTPGQATIVAFSNLYSGTCITGSVPSTYWGYNTGTGDSVVTSPALSPDGKQVAFIQSTSGGTANLVLLRWKANNGTPSSPVAPTSETAANYYNSGAGCTVPCMIAIPFTAGAALGAYTDGIQDTVSSPFYDYSPGSDTLYVGDNSGYIHKFNPVFNGAPAEVTTTWPVIASETPISSPVYDATTGYVFADASFQVSDNSGGRLHAICATATCGTVGSSIASGIMGPSTDGGTCNTPGATATSGDTVNLFVDAPIVDPTNGTIYVAIGNDSTGKSALFQFSSGFASHSCGTEVTLGTGSTTGIPVYSGNFDNLYYTGNAGHMYACGNSGGDATLYQIAVPVNGVLTAGAATTGPALTSATVACSPVTENDSGSVDYIFVSVTNNAATSICGTASGCIMSFIVTTGSGFSSGTTAHSFALEAGGTSGIVIDGSSAASGASQVYFTPLSNQVCGTSGTGGCAIQASQSGLN